MSHKMKQHPAPLWTILLLGLFALFTSSCFMPGTATAEVAFENLSDTRALRAAPRSGYQLKAPETFDVKIAAIYLSEDISPETGNNTGYTPMIYLNPRCGGNISSYDVNNLEFFDLTQSSAQVNAQINARAETIPAVTYRYLRIEFYKYEPTGTGYKNARWGMNDFTREFFRGGAVLTVKMPTPLTVREGQAVKVYLRYDIRNLVAVTDKNAPEYPPSFMTEDIYEDETHIYEFRLPEFQPNAVIAP